MPLLGGAAENFNMGARLHSFAYAAASQSFNHILVFVCTNFQLLTHV